MPKINHIPNDMKIKQIGSLFRNKNSNDPTWAINLSLEDQNKERLQTFTNFSNAKLLRKNGYLNQTRTFPLSYHIFFQISTTNNWFSSIHDSTAQPSKFLEHYFSFEALRIENSGLKTKEKLRVKLPQFELARALFFYTPYLTRSAIIENSLDIDFDIEQHKDHYLINILPACSYPTSHFNDSGIRRILSWILLDQDIRKSFESISQYCTKFGENLNLYRAWNFCFTPPLLEYVIFEAYGYYKADSSEFFVNEILGFKNITNHISKDVEFYSAKFVETKSGKRTQNSSGSKIDGHEPTIKDDDDGNNDNVQILDVEPTRFDFLEAIETKKVSKKSKLQSHGIKDDTLSTPNPTQEVSTKEPISDGSTPSAEFNGVEDLTEDLHLYLDRFSAFQQMIELFCNQNQVSSFSFQLHKLPNITGFSKHIKTDGNPRCVAEVQFQMNGKQFIILEVDTSDNKKPLSTQILNIKDLSQWGKCDRAKILELVVTQCLRWPKGILKKICFKNGTLNHPRMNAKPFPKNW